MTQLMIDFVHARENNYESQTHLNANKAHFNAQCQKVYNLLLSGERLTVLSAMTQHAIFSLPRRVLDLKQQGINVQSAYIEGSRIKEYYL